MALKRTSGRQWGKGRDSLGQRQPTGTLPARGQAWASCRGVRKSLDTKRCAQELAAPLQSGPARPQVGGQLCSHHACAQELEEEATLHCPHLVLKTEDVVIGDRTTRSL